MTQIPPPQHATTDTPVNRSTEHDTLHTALKPLTDTNQPRHAYLHGPPGTGKTMTAQHVLDQLQNEIGTFTELHTLTVNCCTYRTRTAVFEYIDENLAGNPISRGFGNIVATRDRVDGIRQWAARGDGPAVVVLDDIDMLEEPTAVLHDLLEIAQQSSDGFAVVAAGNDPLPALPVEEKAVSRWQPVEIAFDRFDRDELVDVLEAYVPVFCRGTDVQVQEAAIMELAEQVSGQGGDVRTAKRVLHEAVLDAVESGEDIVDADQLDPE